MARRPAVKGAVQWLVMFALISCLVCLSSCGDDEGAGPGMTASDYNEAGWSSYADEDYTNARANFEKALELEAGFSEARLGLAWCEAQGGEYLAALGHFNEVVEAGEYVTDAFAGRSATALAASQDSLAIASAESTLARDSVYEFRRKKEYDWRDIRLITAQAYFGLAQYGGAQEQVDILDPDNGLNPADSGSWVVNGQTYLTYEAALAMEIEWLRSMEGGGALACGAGLPMGSRGSGT